jgi:hypothetical protein
MTLLHDIKNLGTDPISIPLKRFTISLASTIIYGWRTTSVDHPLIFQMFEVWIKPLDTDTKYSHCKSQWIDGFSKLASQAQIADFFPFLRPIFKYIPSQISWFKREATRLNQLEKDTWIPLFDIAKKKHSSGTQRPSTFVRSITAFSWAKCTQAFVAIWLTTRRKIISLNLKWPSMQDMASQERRKSSLIKFAFYSQWLTTGKRHNTKYFTHFREGDGAESRALPQSSGRNW